MLDTSHNTRVLGLDENGKLYELKRHYGKQIPCPTCDGTGHMYKREDYGCVECQGSTNSLAYVENWELVL